MKIYKCESKFNNVDMLIPHYETFTKWLHTTNLAYWNAGTCKEPEHWDVASVCKTTVPGRIIMFKDRNAALLYAIKFNTTVEEGELK